MGSPEYRTYEPKTESRRMNVEKLSRLVEPLSTADSVIARLPHNKQVDNMFNFLAAIN